MLAALAALLLVAALAGTGYTLHGRGPGQLPWTRFSLALARSQSCWHGPLHLAVSPEADHVGEVLALGAEGSMHGRFISGVSTILEARSSQGWSAYDYLWTAAGGPDQDGLSSTRAQPGVMMILPALFDPVYVRVPDVPAGTYRLVRSYSGYAQRQGLPRGGANLCAGLVVLPTPKAFVPAGGPTVTVSPSSGLSGGQEVRVALKGFAPSSRAQLSECAFGRLATSDGCASRPGSGKAVQLGPNGTATTTWRAQASAPVEADARPGGYPCTSNCVLVATLGRGYASAGTSLSFNAPGVTGTLDEDGVSPPSFPKGIPGQVSFVRIGPGPEHVLSAQTAPDGEFSMRAGFGRYHVSGTSPLVTSDGKPMTCFGNPPVITVSRHVPVQPVDVFCNVR